MEFIIGKVYRSTHTEVSKGYQVELSLYVMCTGPGTANYPAGSFSGVVIKNENRITDQVPGVYSTTWHCEPFELCDEVVNVDPENWFQAAGCCPGE